MAERIGLFGGSFDPIHMGHLLVALAACEEVGLSRLYFIPAFVSPFKPDQKPAPARERLRLLRLALAGYTRYEVDDGEIRRGGVSYTIDTVREYRRRFPDATLHYLIGADHVPALPQWKESAALGRVVEFVVFSRPGQEFVPLPPSFSGRQLRGFPMEVSSSKIRDRARRGLPLRGLVPDAVAERIVRSQLYL